MSLAKVYILFFQAEAISKEEESVEMKPGAVYLGHIPHGFYEKEMSSYFSQFGEVTRVKLFRSKKVCKKRLL